MTIEGEKKTSEMSAPLFEAKTIVMEVTATKNQRQPIYIVLHSPDEDILEKVTMCSMHVTKVGKNLPCLSKFTNTFKYDNLQTYSDEAPRAIFGNQSNALVSMFIDVCYFDFSSDPQENKFHVEFTIKPTEKAQDYDRIKIVGEIRGHPDISSEKDKSTEKQIEITLSKNVPPLNVLLSNISYPQVLENTTLIGKYGDFDEMLGRRPMEMSNTFISATSSINLSNFLFFSETW